ncbi:MAG: hypothetical protein ACYCZF_17790 [Anaerolineae bacterium]
MHPRSLLIALILTGLVLSAASCAPQPTLTPVATSAPATQQPTATTVPVPTAVPAATATNAPPPADPPGEVHHPSEARIGITGVDNIIAAVLSGDLAARRAFVRFITTPCTTAQGSGGPPKCAAGEEEGTLVEVFPILGEEGEHVRRDILDLFLNFAMVGLYAVYEVPPYAYHEIYWPAGQYGLIFVGSGMHSSITALVQDDVIVRLNLSRRTPGEELELSKGRVLLPPPH